MDFDVTNFNEAEIAKVNELIDSIKKEKESNQKWWIMPQYDVFGSEIENFGQLYKVEIQEDMYSKSRPPLKFDFNSKEDAETIFDLTDYEYIFPEKFCKQIRKEDLHKNGKKDTTL